MKKQLIIVLVAFIAMLSGCKPKENESTNWVVLPDLNGYQREEIVSELDSLGVTYTFELSDVSLEQYSNQFIMYKNHDIGEIVNSEEEVTILIYPVHVEEGVVLPDLTDLDKEDIILELSGLGLSYYFLETITDDLDLIDTFHSYDNLYVAGDEFDPSSAVGIYVYALDEGLPTFFQIVEMEYDGPYLDESFASIDYLNPRGGYFEVTLNYCTDGDTGKFSYPTDVYEAIQSNAKSTRFLNMDTEETYSGGEEEWGKPASVYTCDLLTSATSIILQTDPNDGLLGTYGRLLAWVWIKLPGEDEYFLLNYMVVKQGLAQVKFEFGAGETISYGEHTYNEWMHIAEDYAIENKLGQWGNLLDYYWNYENDEPYYDRWN